jgi:O-antigen/teichoic acid export membrane protein
VAVYLVNNSIPFLISSKYGAESVADFVVLMKLLAIPGMLLTYALNPLWPAIAEAKQKGEVRWILGAYQKSAAISIVAAVAISPIVFLGAPFIIKHWAGTDQVVPSSHLIVASVAFMLLGFWNGVLSTILNGLSQFKGQASYGMLLATGAVFCAALVPNSYPKESVIWVINVGFAIRCVFMQIEVGLNFSDFSKKNLLPLPKNESGAS